MTIGINGGVSDFAVVYSVYFVNIEFLMYVNSVMCNFGKFYFFVYIYSRNLFV